VDRVFRLNLSTAPTYLARAEAQDPMEAASAMCFHVSPRSLMRWTVRQAQVRADRASTSSSLTVSRPPSAGQDRLGS